MYVCGWGWMGGEEWDGANQFGVHVTVLVGVVHGGSGYRH